VNEKELYRQKAQAQLDKWHAELDILKARAYNADADVKLELNQKIKELESQIEDGKEKLEKLAEKGEDAWKSMKDDVEATIGSLKSSIGDAASKLKN
jgi:predicted  nucleic acid-binding Zn-ribbon protein